MQHDAQAEAHDVGAVLSELGIDVASPGQLIEVWNKIDLLGEERPPPLSPASYLGPEIALMLDNMLLGFEAGQLALAQGVFERKAPA